MTRVRLEWPGKQTRLDRLALPLQVVETVTAARADRGTIFESAPGGGSGWRNLLVRGDNGHVLASLAEEHAGQVDLVYIDPPFDSRQDYKIRIGIGDAESTENVAKPEPVIEEKAYRDTWRAGAESYLQMLYARLVLLRELLSDRGSIFLHLAPNVSHYGRLLLEEVFGAENFRAEVVWKRTTGHADTRDFALVHDTILCFAKSSEHVWHPQHTDYDPGYVEQYYRYRDPDGRRFMSGDLTAAGRTRGSTSRPWRGHDPDAKGLHWRYPPSRLDDLDEAGRIFWTRNGVPRLKWYLDEAKGQPVTDVWTDIQALRSWSRERLGYDTQKPEALLERIIASSSDEGSIVLDCFAGSGTTPAVAERMGRRWIACDIGRFAIHTTRKRLLDIPGCTPFVVADLGRYERQVWQRATRGEEVRAYLDFVVGLYGAEPLQGFRHLHGTRARSAVHVGTVDSPVTHDEVLRALDEAGGAGYTGLDVLGWEWEIGLHELVTAEAVDRGIDLRLRRIPSEVMDQRAVDSGDVVFHELASLEVDAAVKGRTVRVTLKGFVLANPGLVPGAVRDRITTWSDYVDYWAVDFAHGDARAGTDTFHNQWQSYRTRGRRALELTAGHAYDEPGGHTVLVKVVDIFGNDTTTALHVTVAGADGPG